MSRKVVLKLAPRNYELLGADMDKFVNFGFHRINPEILLHGTARGEKPSTVSLINILAMRGFTYKQMENFFYLQHAHHHDWVFGTSVEDCLRNFLMHFADDVSMASAMLHANEIILQHFKRPEDVVERYAERREMENTVSEILFGEDFDGNDIDPITMIEHGQDILTACRIYRADMGNTVDACSKQAQHAVWGDGDVAFKFEGARVTDKVVVAGCGDETGRTHLPFADNVVDKIDPRFNGRILTKDTEFKEGESLVSDIADASGFGLQMTDTTNATYEKIHRDYPDMPMNLKLDLYNLPFLGLTLLKKPTPHNFEVICHVDDDADMSWVPAVKVSAIQANWTRNRNIRAGHYNIPRHDRSRERWVRRSAVVRDGLKQKTELLVKKREIRRAPVARRDYCNRLRAGVMNVGREMALGPALFLFSKLNQTNPPLDVIDLDDYQLYYSHCTAERAVMAMDASLVKVGLARVDNEVFVPRENRERIRTAAFNLLTNMNDHSV